MGASNLRNLRNSHRMPENVDLHFKSPSNYKAIQSLAVGGTVAAGKAASKLLSKPEQFQGDQFKEWSDDVRDHTLDAVTLIGQASHLLSKKVCNLLFRHLENS